MPDVQLYKSILDRESSKPNYERQYCSRYWHYEHWRRFLKHGRVFSALDIPSMSEKTFIKEQEKISDAWEVTALKEMELTVSEERSLAIQRGDVDSEGIPLLTVVVDGSWAKRSYKTNYASLSGVAAIVGLESKKVLLVGVRNKYCVVCARAESKGLKPDEHKCFRNWMGSSSAMEADIIVDGFTKSVEMHGVKYARFIGDGDSNVYKKILDSMPYDNLTVEKIGCKNHLLRNMCNKLKDIARNGKIGHVTLRKLTGSCVLRIRTAVTMAIKYRKEEPSKTENDKIMSLRQDIMNVPFHVFGSHENCEPYFCRDKKDKNYVTVLKTSGLLCRLLDVLNSLSDHARSLIKDVSSNKVEEFNSIVSKFIGGKRINYCLKRSYQARCCAAVVAHNSKTPVYKLHRSMYNCSPGGVNKRSEERKAARRARDSLRKKKLHPKTTFFSS
ncbi:hypothetical protein AVEN_93006-1 [Araneus ventricosus]|uniref:Mutator-like transposase domain-containing protein n=1 Tax=Araneus ventricosus TaxID=182803 RepID=A0A4Y2SK35_ARAVE|nr:hypothetical protein AVEN_93006-1 [Araneus ventricosus]